MQDNGERLRIHNSEVTKGNMEKMKEKKNIEITIRA